MPTPELTTYSSRKMPVTVDSSYHALTIEIGFRETNVSLKTVVKL